MVIFEYHLHGLIFELKERMNSRQDQPDILPSLVFDHAAQTPEYTQWFDHKTDTG